MSRDNIPGRDALIWIYDRWLETNPRQGAVVVEVGVALGKSITYLCDRLREMGRTDVEVWAVDSWCHNAPNGEQQTMAAPAGGDFSLFAKQVLQHDPEAWEQLRVVRCDSVRAAELFGYSSVDLVVLDADHTLEAVRGELEAWCPRIRPGGFIGGDDHHESIFPGVVQACKEKFGTDYETSTANPYSWPLWLKKY